MVRQSSFLYSQSPTIKYWYKCAAKSGQISERKPQAALHPKSPQISPIPQMQYTFPLFSMKRDTKNYHYSYTMDLSLTSWQTLPSPGFWTKKLWPTCKAEFCLCPTQVICGSTVNITNFPITDCFFLSLIWQGTQWIPNNIGYACSSPPRQGQAVQRLTCSQVC